MKKISLANLPTKIVKLERLSAKLGKNIYVKHDDETGAELSGNKVRKLEYALAEAKELGCDLVITTGGIQSNHCRATVTSATRLGMKSAVLLRISPKDAITMPYKPGHTAETLPAKHPEDKSCTAQPAPACPREDLINPEVAGNYFMDRLFGADIHFCSPSEYSNSRDAIMAQLAEEYKKQGYTPYIIPEGASNAVGTLGYYGAMEEIVEQEKELGVKFDAVAVATGSGGTCAGLNLANRVLGLGKKVLGVCVCDDNLYFQERIAPMAHDAVDYLDKFGKLPAGKSLEEWKEYCDFKIEDIEMVDQYVGVGYALSRPEELEFIKEVARMEGIIFDTCYTGKGLLGVVNEIKEGGKLADCENILFIHTGGLFGLFPNADLFTW